MIFLSIFTSVFSQLLNHYQPLSRWFRDECEANKHPIWFNFHGYCLKISQVFNVPWKLASFSWWVAVLIVLHIFPITLSTALVHSLVFGRVLFQWRSVYRLLHHPARKDFFVRLLFFLQIKHINFKTLKDVINWIENCGKWIENCGN